MPPAVIGAQQAPAVAAQAPPAATPQPPAQSQALTSSPPVPPQVTYENGQLSISAPNSTLADVLNAVKAKTGAELDLPSSTARERVAVQLGPGSPRDVLARLLDGSPYNYILLGSPNQPASLTQIVLTPATAGGAPAAGAPPVTAQAPPPQPEPNAEQPDNEADQGPPSPPPQQVPPQPGARMPAEQNAPAEANPNTEAAPAGQVKTPEQLLQELRQMQQREQQQRQQQQKPPQ